MPKKIALLGLFVLLLVFAAGCGQQASQENKAAQASNDAGTAGGSIFGTGTGTGTQTLDSALADCKALGTKTETESCISSLAEREKSGAVCAEIETVNVKDKCYGNVANTLADKNLCGSIVTETIRNACYSNVAVASGDAATCELIENASQAKDQCYYELAKSKNDKALCEKIYGSYLKKKCQTGA